MVFARKNIARTAFDKAYQNEMSEIKNDLRKRLENLDDLQEIWSLLDYLSKRKNEIDKKYDYRYSVLLYVFVRLLRDGFIDEKDLEGLSDEKLNAIKFLSKKK
jgi:hypothetical protein